MRTPSDTGGTHKRVLDMFNPSPFSVLSKDLKGGYGLAVENRDGAEICQVVGDKCELEL